MKISVIHHKKKKNHFQKETIKLSKKKKIISVAYTIRPYINENCTYIKT